MAGKVAFLEGLTGNFEIFAPLGALHLFVSLLINFGWIGSIVVVFAAGATIERLSRSITAPAITSYGVIAAVMMADIWRNPVSQSLVKNVLQGAILLPAVLSIMVLAFQDYLAKRERDTIS